jgi:hypothetical protein
MLRDKLQAAARALVQFFTATPVETLSPPAPAKPATDKDNLIRNLAHALAETKVDAKATRAFEFQSYREFVHELWEARAMRGSGPWLPSDPQDMVGVAPASMRETDLNESDLPGNQGAMGDFELALQSVDWRREINFAWLQFSRWGIQQIILISRLYYLKNPIIRRLTDVCALYTFARGVDISISDEPMNDVLKDFFLRNQVCFGQSALVEQQKAKYYDGNIFWVFFGDDKGSGETNARTIDAVEVQDIICDPEDADTEWYFLRQWSRRKFNEATGEVSTEMTHAWYPALGFDPAVKPEKLRNYPVFWNRPVLHRKCGTVGKWNFGCPRAYPALDWAKASRKYLEACASVKAALAQIAMTITTKGGQQALAGIKQQLETTVATGNSGYFDNNPTAVNGSIFASGPGTALAAFKTSGEGGDPEEVRQYKLMCCMVFGVPETFLGDVQTGNLATATSLDRPTELMFLAEQESWREDFIRIAQYVIGVSAKATSGKVREAHKKVIDSKKVINICEARRISLADGKWRYARENEVPAGSDKFEIKVTFPAIREGDVPALVSATVQAGTLGTQEVVGIDEKTMVILLYELLGVENGVEIAEKMYPEESYIFDRDEQKEQRAEDAAAVAKAAIDSKQIGKPGSMKQKTAEAIERIVKLLKEAA